MCTTCIGSSYKNNLTIIGHHTLLFLGTNSFLFILYNYFWNSFYIISLESKMWWPHGFFQCKLRRKLLFKQFSNQKNLIFFSPEAAVVAKWSYQSHLTVHFLSMHHTILFHWLHQCWLRWNLNQMLCSHLQKVLNCGVPSFFVQYFFDIPSSGWLIIKVGTGL